MRSSPCRKSSDVADIAVAGAVASKHFGYSSDAIALSAPEQESMSKEGRFNLAEGLHSSEIHGGFFAGGGGGKAGKQWRGNDLRFTSGCKPNAISGALSCVSEISGVSHRACRSSASRTPLGRETISFFPAVKSLRARMESLVFQLALNVT